MELRNETTSRKEDGKCVSNVGEIPGKCIVLETKAIWKKKHDNPTHKPLTAEQNEDWEMTSKDSLGSLARVSSRGTVE